MINATATFLCIYAVTSMDLGMEQNLPPNPNGVIRINNALTGDLVTQYEMQSRFDRVIYIIQDLRKKGHIPPLCEGKLLQENEILDLETELSSESMPVTLHLQISDLEPLPIVLTEEDRPNFLYGRHDLLFRKAVKRALQPDVDIDEAFAVKISFDSFEEMNLLFFAVDRNDFDIAKILLENGSDPNRGWAVVQAMQDENLEIMKLLVSYGGKPDLQFLFKNPEFRDYIVQLHPKETWSLYQLICCHRCEDCHIPLTIIRILEEWILKESKTELKQD
jgi:hypothetical protein